MSVGPTPAPMPPYRGPLKFMPGAPTVNELLLMSGLLLGGLLLLLIGWRLLVGYARGRWDGRFAPSHWQLLGAAASGFVGLALLGLLWLELSSIAARMGVTVLVLSVLLLSEAPERRRSRR